MRKWLGILCVILGAGCLLGAIGLVLYNNWEADAAAESSQAMLEDVQAVIQENQATAPAPEVSIGQSYIPATPDRVIPPMATISVDGYDCIGVLSIPVLELELPVLTQWSYAKLKKAPCLYYGSYYEPDFVIAGHNYKAHFGRLSELMAGDQIIFTDATGQKHYYQVALLETLPKEATMEMITSGFDLSLYTCTPGGGSRVTVRCIAQ